MFDKDVKHDRIAMLFVYMPTIECVVKDKVKRWNAHGIRKQSRPDILHGVPKKMYNYPEREGAINHSIKVDRALLADMKRDLEVSASAES